MRLMLTKTEADRLERIASDLHFIGEQMVMGLAARDAIARNVKELRALHESAIVVKDGRAD